MPLKVYWDGYGLDRVQSGVFYYAKNLRDGLHEQGFHPTVVVAKLGSSERLGLKGLHLPSPLLFGALSRSKIFWPGRVGRRLKREEGNQPFILHGLSNINVPYKPQLFGKMHTIVTVHDLIPLLAPGGVSSAYRQQFAFLLPKILQTVDRVICVSEWTKATLIERYPFVTSRCVVIANGMAPLAPPRQHTRSDVIHLLTVSRFEKYKRLDIVLSVMRAYLDQLVATVITDQRGAAFCQHYGADLMDSGKLKVHVAVSRQELINFYKNADIYLHPSELEGFCLPAAEALSLGLPVVYQQGSALDETVGSKVGVAVARGAPVDVWVDAIEGAQRRALAPEFPAALAKHLATKTSWKDAAKALKSLYSEIS